MLILFDQGTPPPIRSYLSGHTVRTAVEQDYDRLTNGQLLDAAEQNGFDLLLTTDKNIRFQQNLSSRRIAIVVLDQQQWRQLRSDILRVVEAVNAAKPGSYAEVPAADK